MAKKISAKNKKMQNVQFKDIEDFFEFLPEEELKILLFLRKLIYDCNPDISERLAYNVPYYKRKNNLFFLWPASVLWGSQKTYQGVRFGFTSGYLIKDEIDYLDKGDRKQVYWKDFSDIHQIDIDLLKSYIFEAILIDQQAKPPLKNKPI